MTDTHTTPAPVTFEEFEAAGNVMMDRHIAAFKIWNDAFQADCTVYQQQLEASSLSETARLTIARAIAARANELENL